MINLSVLMSDADNFSSDQHINPYYNDSPVDSAKAKADHAAIKQAYLDAGIKVDQVASPTESQDGVYTANWALVRGNKAVMSRLPQVRQAEQAYAKKYLQERGFETIEVPNDLRFSGQGDTLACGEFLFAGKTYRSDAEATQFAADQLGYELIQLETVPQLDEAGNPVKNAVSGWPDSFFYDVDLALAIIQGPSADSKGTIAYCREAFTPESQQILDNLEGFDKILVDLKEAVESFACNLVSTGETVIMSDNAPLLQAEVEKRGLKTITPHITDLIKGGGYIRCVSLSLNP